MKTKVSTFLAALTLLEWGGIFVYFYMSGRISAFLHPYFQPWVLVSGLLMLLCSGVIYFTREKLCGHGQGAEGCCGHDHGQSEWSWPQLGKVAVLLFPMAAAALFSPDRFGETLFQNRKAITTAVELPGSFKPDAAAASQASEAGGPPSLPGNDPVKQNPVPASAPVPEAELNSIMDLIYSAGVESERNQMEGKTIAVIGQLARDRVKGLSAGDFGIYELVIMCCAADARPVSIRVEYSGLSPGLKNTDWVRVTGKIHFEPVQESSIPILRAVDVSESVPPNDPYLTP
jgi:uncharacterized repeat protein (TIGR03943 family)